MNDSIGRKHLLAVSVVEVSLSNKLSTCVEVVFNSEKKKYA